MYICYILINAHVYITQTAVKIKNLSHSSRKFLHVCTCMLSCFSHVQLSVTPWIVACQAPLSMKFSRQEYWSGLPCPPPGDLPEPGIELSSLTSPALAGGFFTASATQVALREGDRHPNKNCKIPSAEVIWMGGCLVNCKSRLKWELQFSSVQSLSRVQLFATP